MIILQDITYIHSNRDELFSSVNLTVNRQDKISLIGNNGSGKTTLLRLMAGDLIPTSGRITTVSKPYYIPQHFGQFNGDTVAMALGVEAKLAALQAILRGEVTEDHLNVLNEDWTIEERSLEALNHWQLSDIDLNQKMETLSGGQKTRVFLAGIHVHQPEMVLMDEPSNHLDWNSRALLYEYISSTRDTLVVVSHDRVLLNKIDTVYELGSKGITVYGGNYDFYLAQKTIESEALNQDVRHAEKALRKAKTVERESMQRQQKLDARGKKKQEKAGIATIMLNTLKNKAEKSTAKLKGVHTEKRDQISQELSALRKELPDLDKIKIDFDHSELHQGKLLIKAEAINFGYGEQRLWNTGLNFEIRSGQRWVLQGANGSGKTTLLQLILGELTPQTGTLFCAEAQTMYIDQDYSLINNNESVYQQAQIFNVGLWQEHDIKMRLNRFLFGQADWDKPCSALSGGEKMRLMLCGLTMNNRPPDIIVLDEPTNNLDIQNLEILTRAINDYRGTLLVVTHDRSFMEQIGVEQTIDL